MAGQLVFLDDYLIDMRTGAGADLATPTAAGNASAGIYGGHAVGAFGGMPQSSQHGMLLGYAVTGDSADGPVEILLVDTTKLPDLQPPR